MSAWNNLRRMLLWGLSVKDTEGFLTVNSQNDSITIELPFDPVDVDAEFTDEDNNPSCVPSSNVCWAEIGDYSITIHWSVMSERKIRWSAAERVL